ncbi:MAG: hypothetical protein PHW08_03645 [Kiritimatiellae bacterium]|nr:hypothetical protein [Kiritimatiellia bacterium]
MNIDIAAIRQALDDQRFETARRMCLSALDRPRRGRSAQDVRLLLHEALSCLGDIKAAQGVLEDFRSRDPDERLHLALLLAEDYHKLAAYDFYRGSVESAQGLTGDEYADKYEALADQAFSSAIALADTPIRKQRVAAVMRRTKRQSQADALAPLSTPESPAPIIPAGRGAIVGRLTCADGTPVRNATVTLGFPQAVSHPDPRGYLGRGIGGGIESRFHGEQITRTVATDDLGVFRLDDLPSQRYPYLAVSLDPDAFDVAVHFFGRDIDVPANGAALCDGLVEDWASAPEKPVDNPFPEQRTLEGASWHRIATWTLRNPFHFAFPRQFVAMPRRDDTVGRQVVLLTSDAVDELKPVQALSDGTLGFFLDLPERTDRVAAIYARESSAAGGPAPEPSRPTLDFRVAADGLTAVIDTGRAMFRIAAGEGVEAIAPLLAVRGEDGLWRGAGRLLLPGHVAIAKRATTIVEQGALLLRVEVAYGLSTGETVRFEMTAHAGEAYLLVRETTVPIDGLAFEFSLREFIGGRGFLHWTPEHGGRHWSTLEVRNLELARLQESVAWWIPPQGFGYAMTPDGLDAKDYVGVFTRRRGEWIDRAFERISQGPGDANRELDWPYPEMVGSTISMITAHTSDDGDAWFRFAGFDGERQWGVLVSTLARNDGPYKELSSVQHKVSSPRLQDFMTWRLHESDSLRRPMLLMTRDEIRGLRRKRRAPGFAAVWKKLVEGHQRGPSRGLRALLESDPALIWRLACEMRGEAPLRARMTLLGRDYADVYSPVGGRGITPFAEQYDLIAPTGVFRPDEEREIRAMLLLMGHLFMEEDFMNWRFNSRNANFEADRTDIVGTVGLAFRGNPDADGMVRHASELMERSLNVYCTPGSGKWYENPACYYIHAASCRLNLAFHLWNHGLMDVAAIPRLKDFLSWGPLLLTARYPHDYALLRDGCSFEAYEQAEKVRRIPPIGDHAKVGQWVSEFYALMAKAYQARDPGCAEFLRWAYQEGGSDGGHFSKFPLFFTAMDEGDLAPARPQTLASRRLEGFGAVFRGGFGTPDEFYLLFKQGPGGYRYHRTEGSFLLMAHGRPLVWDGGEAGETWRHSTLSFHDTHMPLAPGHVERFHSLSSVDFAQGVHPKALSPGDPVFLSDSCEHTLVDVAWERFREPDPADVRSVLWVKDQYVVVFDDLHLPPGTQTHWHVQMVGDSQEGSLVNGGDMRLHGRFGVDLQLLMPDLPPDARETVAQVPTLEYNIPPAECFAMRHVQVSMISPRRLFAVLRPLAPGGVPLAATVVDGVLRIQGEGVDDTLFLFRDPVHAACGDVRFAGRYGAVLKRPRHTTLVLLDGETIACGAHAQESIGERTISQ